MKIQKITTVCAAVACALSFSASAANVDGVAMKNAAHVAGITSSDDINHMLNLTAATQMKAAKEVRLPNGVVKVRYQQTYQGIPVFGHSVAATRSEMGALTNVRGQFADLDNHLVALSEKVSGKQALASLLGDKLDRATNKQSQKYVLIHEGAPRLVHMVSGVVHDVTGPSRPTAFVDAATGAIVDQWDNIQFAAATGPGGNTKTGQYYYGTDFSAMDVAFSNGTSTMNNTNVKTINLNHGTSGNQAYSFSGTENTHKQINGAYSPLNDAHYFGGVVFNMFDSWYNTAPLTFQLTLRVHYSNNYENAFWDGSTMTFGDGQNTFHPLVSLDVTAHEVSHGFTEQNSGLVYSNQSGGMNEAFSDMSGEAAEYFMHGSNDWLVGEQIFKSTGALRYMSNPPQDGVSIGHADDYYSGMGVHYSSGVYNKAFYTLATTSGWNTRTAFDVMVLANQTYWTANSTFDDGACGVESASDDLGYNTADVTAAFAAVGVACGGTGGGGTEYDVTGSRSNISVGAGQWKRYSFNLPAGKSELGVSISGGTGDADLYVRHGARPTTTAYDCRPYLTGNNETCTFTNPDGGRWHAGIRGYTAASGVTISYGYNH